MNWIENIDRWRRLSAAAKLHHRWEAIPADVAESMSFEGEPVPVETIRAFLSRIDPPVLLQRSVTRAATQRSSS